LETEKKLKEDLESEKVRANMWEKKDKESR